VEKGEHIASKTEAETFAGDIRAAINAGTYVRADDRRKTGQASTPDGITLDAFGLTYVDRVSSRRAKNKSWKNDQHTFATMGAFRLPNGQRFGDKTLAAITEDDFEAYVSDRRERGRATSTTNKDIQLIKAAMRWATRKGYLQRNPISGESLVLKRQKNAQRNRRISDEEIDKLLSVSDQNLQLFIVAAFDTCCRLTELYRLLRSDRRGGMITIREDATKVETAARSIPVSPRLAAWLAFVDLDPTGNAYDTDTFQFGELGQPPTDINDRFKTAVLKSQGIAPTWANGVHSREAREALKRIDLLFSDFRHEGAVRKYEAGWLLHEIRDLLGHTSLEQTCTYLNVPKEGLDRAMSKFGTGAKVGQGEAPTRELIAQPLHTRTKNGASREKGEKP
jgi:integrase